MHGNDSKSLGSTIERERRAKLLHEPHIKPLTQFVERLRVESGHGDAVPFFDPLDGGVAAKILFVLEAPGPKAVITGFVSRDNPDDTACNWLRANREAGLARKSTLIWNIVPWYLGANGKIRPAQRHDIDEGWSWLSQLLQILPRLGVVVLVGRKAEAGKLRLRTTVLSAVSILVTPHPSPQFVNRHPENWGRLVSALRRVKDVSEMGAAI